MISAAHERAGFTDGFSVCQASSGAPVGTYFVFAPQESVVPPE